MTLNQRSNHELYTSKCPMTFLYRQSIGIEVMPVFLSFHWFLPTKNLPQWPALCPGQSPSPSPLPTCITSWEPQEACHFSSSHKRRNKQPTSTNHLVLDEYDHISRGYIRKLPCFTVFYTISRYSGWIFHPPTLQIPETLLRKDSSTESFIVW